MWYVRKFWENSSGKCKSSVLPVFCSHCGCVLGNLAFTTNKYVDQTLNPSCEIHWNNMHCLRKHEFEHHLSPTFPFTLKHESCSANLGEWSQQAAWLLFITSHLTDAFSQFSVTQHHMQFYVPQDLSYLPTITQTEPWRSLTLSMNSEM